MENDEIRNEMQNDFPDHSNTPENIQENIQENIPENIPETPVKIPESLPVINDFPEAPRKKKRVFSIKIAALCIVCLLLGSALGIIAFGIINDPGNAGLPLGSAEPNGDVNPETIANSGSLIHTPDINTSYTGNVLTAAQIYAASVNSVVGITTPVTTTNIWGQLVTKPISGSGFIISEDGYILTNYHVVEVANAQNLEIKVMLYTGEEYTAKIVGIEPENDVALIKINASGLSPVVLGTLEDMYVGDPIYVIGNPLGELTWTLTDGIVSAFDREIRADTITTINMFQISAPINKGNSGGPVFNNRGQVIGIASAKYSSSGVEGLGFAIPIDDVKPMIEDFIQYGYVRGKAYFGITVGTVDSQSAMYYDMPLGAFVEEVDERSCAGKAGLQKGDIIVGVDDFEIKSMPDLKAAKKSYSAGDTATLRVYRRGEYIELKIVFDEEGPPRALNRSGK